MEICFSRAGIIKSVSEAEIQIEDLKCFLIATLKLTNRQVKKLDL